MDLKLEQFQQTFQKDEEKNENITKVSIDWEKT